MAPVSNHQPGEKCRRSSDTAEFGLSYGSRLTDLYIVTLRLPALATKRPLMYAEPRIISPPM